MKKWIVLSIFLAFCCNSYAQTGTGFGIKGGLALANQSWNQSEREFLFAYHGDLFLESVNDSLSVAFYVAAGYHVRGSSIRVRQGFIRDPDNPSALIPISGRRFNHTFNNISLQAGAKNFHSFKDTRYRGYYGLGIRVEYTVDYELAFGNDAGYDLYLNRFNYGLSVLGGIELEFPNFPGAIFLEMSFHPDVSKQIFIPANTALYYDWRTGDERFFSEQKVFNRTLEITLGYKFIRRFEWVD